MPEIRPEGLRWRLSDQGGDEGRLFTDFAPERHVGVGEYRGLEFIHVEAVRVLNRVPASSRMPFRWTINAYRGCSHACCYCFARPTHAHLGLDTGKDFESKIVVKVNAIERVRAELASSRWRREAVAMGTNTDPYLLGEGRYHLTRGIVQSLADARNDFSILTKSTLVLRDLELLVWAAKRCSVRLAFSIGTLDQQVAQLTEPGAPPPKRRLAALERVRAAGLSCGVLVAPVIPGLSDAEDQIASVVSAVRAAGATSVHVIPLHLRPGVREHYFGWLEEHRPDLLALHHERFGRRSEQRPAIRQRLGALAASNRTGPDGAHRQPPPRRRVANTGALEQLPLF